MKKDTSMLKVKIIEKLHSTETQVIFILTFIFFVLKLLTKGNYVR